MGMSLFARRSSDRSALVCPSPSIQLAFQIDGEIEAHKVGAEEEVTEIDDRAGSVADDAAQLGYRCRFMDAKVPSELEVRFANRQCLLDVPEIGVACSE